MDAPTGERFVVYVLVFEADGKRYVGSTNDLKRRISEHRRGHVRSTRDRGAFRLAYSETFAVESEAREREKFLKTGQGREELRQLLSLAAKS